MLETKSAKAFIATKILEQIILERFLTNALPKSKKLYLKQVYKYTGYEYYSLRNYIHSDIFTISKDVIKITDNTQLLSDKSKKYIEKLIKKAIYPANHEQDKFICLIAKLFNNSYFTYEEQNFIELMTNELFLLIDYCEISHRISYKDLIGFYHLNHHPFLCITRKIYNDILHKKLRAGENIMEYIKARMTDIQIAEKLEDSRKYDCFFDNYGILKCDLDTNKDILIKNFLSTILYDLTDDKSKTILLLKLNSKYPFLISEKIFYEFD